MSAENFQIRSDPSRHFLHIVWSGYWDLAVVEAYKTALGRAIANIHARGTKSGEVVAMVDARKLGPQSQEVTEAYKKSFADPALKPRRLATLLSSALFKMQVQRLAVADQRIFEDEEEALAWLFA